MSLDCMGFSYRELDFVRQPRGFNQLRSGYSLQVRHEARLLPPPFQRRLGGVPSPGFPLLSGVGFNDGNFIGR